MKDAMCRSTIERNPNLAVPWFLMASYLYYHEDCALISDGLFDEICRRLEADWDDIDHWHKPLIDRASLRAGTGFSLPATEYPARVIGAALSLLRDDGAQPTPDLVATGIKQLQAVRLGTYRTLTKAEDEAERRGMKVGSGSGQMSMF